MTMLATRNMTRTTSQNPGKKRSRSRSSSAADSAHESPPRSRHRRRGSNPITSGLPPPGVQPISKDDFFLKSLEFKVWLKNDKNKFIDQLDSHKSKKYFEKFVRYWNKGKLDEDYYNRATTLDREKARQALQEASIGPSLPGGDKGPGASKPAIIGPSLPSHLLQPSSSSSSSTPTPTTLADHQYKVDQELDGEAQERILRKNEAKRKRKEDKEEESANRATGKDRLLEKRKEKRDAQGEYLRQRDDPTGPELDDRSLFGSNNSFQEAIRARDRAKERRTGKNASFKVEKQLVMQEKVAAMKSKEDETMAMFKALAASKFGPSGSR
ncbi:uncharacterized protein PGTG_09876 [Puccinia graminis f. sp. tritici CRL 75-36-700-3]|uniref:Uncharacterized protein n=1 Tax=Puccinia graminis f. sp. tritici (strain CRL 75-36-700-3 / race SCCL) TaxID=418459 RepID=E3KF81_PUCGT|nr:uncharacterized protein PGTG_09876 [Puccinia graminis f. sp. tritici CRL 75-36-700-3]EFP82908.2 hypothetical protein PGTG_09876 [Puccinia graminis f. sp. tritici CRL 75-36-700-3]